MIECFGVHTAEIKLFDLISVVHIQNEQVQLSLVPVHGVSSRISPHAFLSANLSLTYDLNLT